MKEQLQFFVDKGVSLRTSDGQCYLGKLIFANDSLICIKNTYGEVYINTQHMVIICEYNLKF